MHIISTKNFTTEKIKTWLDLAKKISQSPQNYSLAGKLAGTLFFEPSTRTRWSTEAAMLRLGGQILSMESAKENSSDKKGESLADTFMTCSQYVDCLIVRHPQDNIIQESVYASSVPVISAGEGSTDHPTQALLDLYTILQHLPDPTGKSILFTGDITCSRTATPLAKLLEPYKMQVIVEGCYLKDYNSNVDYVNDIYTKLPEVDILYMTRHQTERSHPRDVSKFVLTNALACTMKKNAIIMHPLPRNAELLPEVDNNPRAVYRKQIKNGMFVRMALLYDLLKW